MKDMVLSNKYQYQEEVSLHIPSHSQKRIKYNWYQTDIEKVFLHVQLHPDDTNFTRFLWLTDVNNPLSEFKLHCFKVALFGIISSPFILHAALFHHLQRSHSPIAAI